MVPPKVKEEKEVPMMKKEFSQTCVTPTSPKIPTKDESKSFHNSTDRRDMLNDFQSEDSHHLEVSSSSKLVGRNVRKPSDSLVIAKGILHDGVSTVTANQSSDMITAHFQSNHHKSMTSNDSPLPEREAEGQRQFHEDPINFLKRFNLL